MAQFAKSCFLSFLLVFSLKVNAGDRLLTQVDDWIAENQLKIALEKVEKQLSSVKESSEWKVRKSRILSLMGDAKSLEEEKIDLYQKAQAVATAAIESDPENAGGYLRRAVAAGKLALYQGILQSRALVIQVKNDATNALELKSISSYRKALAHYLLGKVHLKLAEKPKALRIPLGLGWASKEKGEAYIEKAATRAPQSIPFSSQLRRNADT